MTARGTVLISGASIAGPALAYWLTRYGFQPTVVERADALRTAGQNIDVRGAGREVARRMGIEQRIREATTGEVGTRFEDDEGRTVAQFPAGTGDSDGATAELEILRGELARLLVDLTTAGVEYRYADEIGTIDQDDDGVDVAFAGGGTQRFDLVVLAEGMRSRTRELVFGGEIRMRDLGLYTAYGVIAREPGDDDWWRWYTAVGGRSITLRPDNVGTTRATLSWLSPARDYEERDVKARIDLLREIFADAGWQTGRVLDALGTAQSRDELYLEHIGQVLAPTWSHGRVAMVGDAAYCASPISGMGTSLSLTGAYVLAGELAAHVHHRDAFRRYEALMRPYVDTAQKLPPGTPRNAHPRSRAGVAVLRTGLRLAASTPGRALGGKLFTPPADRIDLPDYDHLVIA